MQVKLHSIGEAFCRTRRFENQTGTCPHCSTNGAMFKQVWSGDIPDGQLHAVTGVTNCISLQGHVAKCLVCGGVVFGLVRQLNRDGHREAHYVWPTEVWPDAAPAGLEEDIRRAYDEARRVLAVSPMAAATLVRRSLQHVIRVRLGIQERTLFEEIRKAVQRPELSKPTQDSLDHVREIGNWGAHPSVDQAATLIAVERNDAEYTLEVLEMLFQDLYVQPARAERMRQRLETKREGSVEGEKACEGSRASS